MLDSKWKRRARESQTEGTHTLAEWEALKAHYNYTCLRCGKREPEIVLERDHVIPLGAPGSSDTISNIQPLCRSCNAWKGQQVVDFRP
ncbi:MAG: HNH endonuclease [Chloroflexaceae bacterium]|nr:HNH endonuclease [Chloroflexaceae bacterium]